MITETFNKKKFKELLHYLIFRCGNKSNVGKTVLFKLLYFSDFNYYEKYEKSLTNESYKKLPYGPAPIHFNNVIKELEQERKIKETKKTHSDKYKFDYSSLKTPHYHFSKKELSTINEVINKLGNKNAKEISDYSHGDMPWMATEPYEIIDYEFVFYRDPEYSVRVYDESD